MKLIENLDAPGFAAYLSEHKNTICGRHPIAVFLNVRLIDILVLSENEIKYSEEIKKYESNYIVRYSAE
jgi:MEMO1 family protein